MVFSTPTAGPVHLGVRFTEAGSTLDMEVGVFYALESIAPGEFRRADVGVGEIIKMIDLICRRAADAGYLRLRAHGVRTGYKEGFRSFEVDLARRGRGRQTPG